MTAPRRQSLRIDFACNDPDNGLFTGRVPQLAIPAVDAEFTARAWTLTTEARCPTLREEPGRIVFSGKPWDVTGSRYGIGNWCWTGWFMRPPVAWAFLGWMHRRGLYQLEACEVWFGELWEATVWPDVADQGFLVRWMEASHAH